MSRQIDHLETAKELLEIADEHAGWMEDELTERERFGIQQLNLAAIAHALIAAIEDGAA